MEDTWFDKFLTFIGWWKFSRLFEEWIYPGYYLKNLLFNRYDCIKIKSVKPYEYAEPDYLMFEANMELIVRFIEKYEPEKYIDWYDEYGAKYGDSPNHFIVFPEYKNKWIMDIIKEIYHWYTKTLNITYDEVEYLSYIWREYIAGSFECIEHDNGLSELIINKDNTIKSLKEFDQKNIKLDWEILDKYFTNREDLVKENKLREVITNIELGIIKDKQKYLHLCIDIRPYLWT